MVGLQSKSIVDNKGVVLGNGVTIESGARIQGNIGDSSVVEIGAGVETGSIIEKVGGKLYLNPRNFVRLDVETLLVRSYFVLFPLVYQYYSEPLFDLKHYGEVFNGDGPKTLDK